MTIRFAPLSKADPDAVEQLLDAAFGVDRKGRTAYRLREGMRAIPSLSFAAFDGDELVGSIQCWPVTLTDGERATPLILVGPVAVSPGRQRGGIGQTLMEHMLEAADATEGPALVLIGDPEYYGRFFGFDAEPTQRWELPGPFERRRLLVRTQRPLPATGQLGPRVPELTRA